MNYADFPPPESTVNYGLELTDSVHLRTLVSNRLEAEPKTSVIRKVGSRKYASLALGLI